MARIFQHMLILGLAAVAGVYLMFPSLVPDVIPVVGWLDEGAATVVLLNTFRFYGIDLTNLYERRGQKRVVRRVVRKGEDYDPAQLPSKVKK